MKALILSVSTGGGHGRAAEAIRESILINDPNLRLESSIPSSTSAHFLTSL